MLFKNSAGIQSSDNNIKFQLSSKAEGNGIRIEKATACA